ERRVEAAGAQPRRVRLGEVRQQLDRRAEGLVDVAVHEALLAHRPRGVRGRRRRRRHFFFFAAVANGSAVGEIPLTRIASQLGMSWMKPYLRSTCAVAAILAHGTDGSISFANTGSSGLM